MRILSCHREYQTDIITASGGPGSLTTSWQNLGNRITTPANTAKIKIQLTNYMNSGWAAFDDVSLNVVPKYQLTYDAENRLVTVSGTSIATATFVYDGDGNRVKSTGELPKPGGDPFLQD